MTKIEAATKKYETAYAKSKAANEAMRLAEKQYRTRQIGDEQFLAARKSWVLAQKEFDAAYTEAEKSGVSEANLV